MPAVAQDGGDITFYGFERGVVYLQMQGACAGCPSSTMTLKMGIENLLRHYILKSQRFARLPSNDLFLSFDTSAAHCAAALLCGRQIIASQADEMDKGQAESLGPLVSEMLTSVGKSMEEVTYIGVGIGPGISRVFAFQSVLRAV